MVILKHFILLTRAMHRLLIFYWVAPRLSDLWKLYNYEVTLKA